MQQPLRETLPPVIEELNTLVHSWPALIEDVPRTLENDLNNIVSNLSRKIEIQFTGKLLTYDPDALGEKLKIFPNKKLLKDRDGNNPLHYLCKQGRNLSALDFAKYLHVLVNYWPIDATNSLGRTALHEAIANTLPLDKIEKLFEKKAGKQIKYTKIHFAKYLLDVSKTDNNGRNCLHFLCEANRGNLVITAQRLHQVACLVPVDLINPNNALFAPPLQLAILNDHFDLANWLYLLSSENTKRYIGNRGRNILHEVSEWHAQRLEYIFKHYSSDQLSFFANTPDKDDKLPIDLAAQQGNWQNCAKLIPVTTKIKCVGIHSLVVYLIEYESSDLLEQLFIKEAIFDEHFAARIITVALCSKDLRKLKIIQEQGNVDMSRFSEQEQIQLISNALHNDNPLAEYIIQNIVAHLGTAVKVKVFEHLIDMDSDVLLSTAISSLGVTDGNSLLYFALKKSRLPAFRLLLPKVNVHMKFKPQSLLTYAIAMHKTDFALELVRSNARIEQEEIDQVTDLRCDAKQNCRLRMLIISNTVSGINTPLTQAIHLNDLNMVKQLLAEYAWPNYPNSDGSYPIHQFAGSNADFFNEALPLLVNEYGMDINKQNASGDTLLHLVAHDDIKVRKLLKYDPACVQNANNRTPSDMPNAAEILKPFFDTNYFARCIETNDTRALQKYLPEIASYIKLDKLQSLLHMACKHQLKEAVEVLLSFGGDANGRDHEGKIPKQHCSDNIELCELLDSHCLNSDGYTSIQKQFQSHSICETILPNLRQSSAAIRDKDGCTLMHYGAMKYCACLKKLLELKIDINAADNNGQTPLHMAIKYKAPNSIKALIEAGANKSMQNNEGKTPLHIAVEDGYMEGFNNVINNENMYIRDKSGRTPIACAIELKRNDFIRTLSPKEEKDVKFSDMIGLEKAKEHLQAVLEIYKDPIRSKLFGVTLPQAILFAGPPGVGKTMLARAFSNELSCLEIKGGELAGLNTSTKSKKFNFQVVPVSQFNHRHPGVGEEELKKTFKEAYEKAPTVLFFDEIDSLGGIDRGNTTGEVSIENKKILNTLLAEMDGFNKKTEEVIIIGATNYVHTLDKAFKDRFQVIITFELPNTQEREQLFNQFFNRIPLLTISNEFVQQLAIKTNEFSIRQMRTLVENGCRFAFIRKHKAVTESVFSEAYDSSLSQHNEHNRKRKREEEEENARKIQKQGNVQPRN